jgi:hypothetical protein
VIHIPNTPGRLLEIARAIDRFRGWCEAEDIDWPTLDQECTARERLKERTA